MQHPHKSFHPTPLRVERDQAGFGIWKHTNVFPSRTAAWVHGIDARRPSLPNGGTIGDLPLTLIFELTFMTDGVRHGAGYDGLEPHDAA